MGEGAYDRLHARVGDALAHDLEAKKKGTYVDNRRDAGKAEVRRAHRAGESRGTRLRVVDPEHAGVPLAASPDLTLTPIVPPGWPPTCSHDPNDCSIGLRIDFCSSSVLFMGDAEHDEEARLDPHGHVGVLQVAHHGSETSIRPASSPKRTRATRSSRRASPAPA
jgi:hypothetical protein